MFGQGISKEVDVLDLASNVDIIVKSGSWYSYGGSKIGQGRENAKQYLKEHPEILEEVSQNVRAHYGLTGDGQNGVDAGQKPEETAAASEETL